MIFRDIVFDARYLVDREDSIRLLECELVQCAGFCVSDLYLRFLPKVVTPSTAKVIVAASGRAPIEPEETRIERLIEVLRFPWRFPFDDVIGRDEAAKKRAILDALHEALVWLAKREGWSLSPFETAYRGCLDCGIVNAFFWKDGKAWASPNRRHKARIFYRFGPWTAETYAVIYDKADREVGWSMLTQVMASDAIIAELLGSCEWKSDEKFVVHPRRASPGKKNRWLCSLKYLQEPPFPGRIRLT